MTLADWIDGAMVVLFCGVTAYFGILGPLLPVKRHPDDF